MTIRALPPALRLALADRFRALAEPARLQLLSELRAGERTVSELVTATGLGQANVSKHLQQLSANGFVHRRKEGTFVYYALADRDVFELCDLMCGRIEEDLRLRDEALHAGA